MAKQLRIEAAELTDVGRKRSENQDNLAQRVPDDPQELEQDGALFVVADGMGGHAAGEVASTVAVQTITSTYFEAAHGDVLQGLAQAIKQANEAILTIARENVGRAGMGTTLVAAVLCQGILYVANIGDSRAYIVRNGKLRQLTEDHSWVAEQVRAGVLTEEQARNHVHRNVITRSLGTQINVTADVFVEPAREGDTLLLCSDGLHGYVNDVTISDVVSNHSPEEAAKLLVNLANEAGGPDNITVSIFHISEMPEASPEVLAKLQLLKEQPRPTRPVPIVAKATERASVAAPAPPVPLTIHTNGADDDVAVAAPARPRRRVGAWIVRVAAVILIVAISLAAWDFTLGPFAQSRVVATRVTNDLNKSKSDLAALSTHVLPDQLAILSTDQQLLTSDLGLDLTAAQRSSLQSLLDSQIVPAVRSAIVAYDAQAQIVPLSAALPNAAAIPPGCASNIYGSLVVVPAPKGNGDPNGNYFFAGTVDGKVQLISQQLGQISCDVPFAANVDLLTNAPGGAALLINDAANPANSSIATISSDNKNPVPILKLPALAAGTTIPFFAYSPKTIVVVQRNIATQVDTLVIYSGGPKFVASGTPIALSQSIRSLGFGDNNVLYLLLNNGAMATFVPGANTEIHLVGDLQVLPALVTG
ncbi:MAG: Stp1/IreP family PP2C-type Ser/Thr phosphatase, partial [Ktedonobacterales bacterium]|nr:Stp1/IreP family PP2C-type Ser/Thr phosphatase [Ktedonobacterales bacterium]